MTPGRYTIQSQHGTRRAASAFTLVEVLLAMGVLAIGLAAVASIYPVAVLQQRRAMDDMNGTIIGQNVLQVLDAVGQSAFPNVSTGNSYVRAERLIIVDGVVNGTTVSSASNAFTLNDATLGISGGDRVVLVGNTGSYSSTVTATTATGISIASAVAPNNNPANPQDGHYMVIVYPSNVLVPWVPTEPIDRGTVNSTWYAKRRTAYQYSIAYRRQNAGGPVDVIVFISRRVTPDQQSTMAAIDSSPATTFPVSTTSGLVQQASVDTIDNTGTLTITAGQPDFWPASVNWASDRNQYVFGYDSTGGGDDPAIFRVIASDNASSGPVTSTIDTERAYSHNRVLFLPQGAIGITTGVIE